MNLEYVLKFGILLLKIVCLLYGLKYVFKVIYVAYIGPLSKIPGPKIGFLTKLYMDIRQMKGQRWKWLHYEILPKYGRVVRVAPRVIVIADKDILKQILVTNELPKNKNYDKLRVDENYSTLFTTRDLAFHKARRRVLSPVFSMKQISSLESLMGTCCQDLTDKIDEMITLNDSKDAVVDIYNLINLNALDTIGETSFGGSFKLVKYGSHPLPGKMFKEFRRRVLKSMFPVFGQFSKVDPYLVDFTKEIIKQRRQSATTRKDLLQALLDAKDSNGNGLSDFEIFDQCFEFLLAGSDSTSFTTSITLIELIRRPEVYRKLVEELDKVISKYDSNKRLIPPYDILKNLPYLDAVINEGLRLYPSSRDLGPGKEAVEDMVIGDYSIPKGTVLTANIFAVHHSKEYWGENSYEFVPERWLNPENIPVDGFIPFLAGSRNCIGQNFARMELKLTIPALVLKYEFEDIPGQDNEILQFLTTSLRGKSHNVIARHRIKNDLIS
ncbi:10436_t:CDS:10 [Acaulospora morrowiae]|uniref:10436_t:CDS:1 n=1 Tax=Acaulospora morrowiae TaxID=94023 RepID=A0A9N9GN94_9GLOM|nr:10436_t:CDS:10 [Acaulospora morrowiae]